LIAAFSFAAYPDLFRCARLPLQTVREVRLRLCRTLRLRARWRGQPNDEKGGRQ
jgi:hypothetical protein